MYKSPFLNEFSDFMMVRRYSKRTIKTYLMWIPFFILFSDKQHPSKLGASDVEHFLTHLAVNRKVAASIQALALNSLIFLYSKFLEQPLGDMSAFKRSKRQAKLPTVLTQSETPLLFEQTPHQHQLLFGLLYGSGLRRMEAVRLRTDNIDVDLKQVRVWNGKGFKHRFTTLAVELLPMIDRQIKRVESFLISDQKNKVFAGVWNLSSFPYTLCCFSLYPHCRGLAGLSAFPHVSYPLLVFVAVSFFGAFFSLFRATTRLGCFLFLWLWFGLFTRRNGG